MKTEPPGSSKEPPSRGDKPSLKPSFTLSRLLRELLRDYKRDAILTVILFTIKSSPLFVMPIAMAHMIDLIDAPPQQRISGLIFWLIVLAFVLIQNVPMHTLFVAYQSRITRGIGRSLRVQLCRQLQNLTILFHARTSVGTIQTKAIRDIENIERIPELLLGTLFIFIVQLIVAIVSISMRAPWAMLLFVIVIPVGVLLQMSFRKSVRRHNRDLRLSMEGMTTTLQDMLEMIPITRAHGLEDRQITIMEKKIQQVFDRGRSVDRIVAMFNAASFVSFHLLQFSFLGVTVYSAFQGWLTVGDVVLFNSFLLSLFGQMMALLGILPQLSQARESFLSIQEVLNAPDCEENDGKADCSHVSGEFRLEEVTYQYPLTNTAAVRDVTLHVKQGECIAFVGPSGSGKSTMLSLLLGFVRPDSGAIMLDNIDMQQIDLRTYRRSVSVVTQEPVFFSGTVAENVTYGNSRIESAKIIEALRQANALRFVQDLPEGIHTRIGAEGVKLSGGQQQRLAIARAIIRDPRILILDEATSALDADSERVVQEALDQVMRGRTTFIVAHRISTVRNADRIVILENGRIADIGTPDELLQRDNFYSRAVQAQAIASDLAV